MRKLTIQTLILLGLQALLQRHLIDAELGAAALSPQAAEALPALLQAAFFIGLRMILIVVLPALWVAALALALFKRVRKEAPEA